MRGMTFLHRIAAARTRGRDKTDLAEQNAAGGKAVSNAQLAAMGVAGMSPFAGMIGEQPIRHDPLQGAEGHTFETLRDLENAARSGDVVLMSKPEGSFFKNVIMPSGDSQFYHAQPITHTDKGRAYTVSAGDLHGVYDNPEALRDPDTLFGAVKEKNWTLTDYMSSGHHPYTDAVLLRPKKPMTPEELRRFKEAIGDRATRIYDDDKGIGTFFRNTFVPKHDFFTRGRPDTVCEGNVCSTMPAQAYHEATGRDVIPGKRAQDVFPTDFMRSGEFDQVGSHVSPKTRALEKTWLRRAAPWLLRGGMGAGLALGTYEATEHPAEAGAVGGLVGSKFYIDSLGHPTRQATLHPRIADFFARENMPTYADMATTYAENGLRDPETWRTVKNFLGKRVPLTLGAAALGYGGVKALGAGYDALKDRVTNIAAAHGYGSE